MPGEAKAAEDWGWEVFVAFTARDMQRGCDLIGKAMAQERAAGRAEALDLDRPWPVGAMLVNLIDATDHLLKAHDCDHLGWETISAARDAAKAWLERTLARSQPPREPANAWCTCGAGESAPMHARSCGWPDPVPDDDGRLVVPAPAPPREPEPAACLCPSKGGSAFTTCSACPKQPEPRGECWRCRLPLDEERACSASGFSLLCAPPPERKP